MKSDLRMIANGTFNWEAGSVFLFQRCGNGKFSLNKTPVKEERSHSPTDTFGRPLRDLRISVTDRCNFRCPYCMPAEIYGERYQFLPKQEILTFEEMARLANIFAELGVTKFRITGGEPLVRAGLPNLIAMLCKIPRIEDVALTTNGFLLAQNAKALKEAGLKRITVSLDSLNTETYNRMSGVKHGLGPVMAGIEAATKEGLTPMKINAVVQKGVNGDEVTDIASHFRGTGHILRFIEFMDVGNINGWRPESVLTGKEIVEMLNEKFPLEPSAPNYVGEVARRYRYKDGKGEIGIISSVSQPFCRACTRARLTTNGQLVTCLFASSGTDLKSPLRLGASDQDLRGMIEGVWRRRSDRYSEIRSQDKSNPKIEMYQLGG